MFDSLPRPDDESKDDSNDIANWPPHTGAADVVSLHEEVKMGNLQLLRLRKNNGQKLRLNCL